MKQRTAIVVAVASALIVAPSAAMAQSVSGEIGIHSAYLDDDLFPLTDEPVVQAGLYLDVSDNCSLDVWGSHGIATKVGGELMAGGSCRFNFSEDTEIEISAYRDFLIGFDDITEMSAKITHGPIDATVTQYFWDNNPDATRFTVGYTIKASDKLTLRPSLVYQTGFGEDDVAGGGMRATYAITDQLSLIGTVLTPFAGDRNTEASIGLNFTF